MIARGPQGSKHARRGARLSATTKISINSGRLFVELPLDCVLEDLQNWLGHVDMLARTLASTTLQ